MAGVDYDRTGMSYLGPEICLACRHNSDGKCKLNPPKQSEVCFDDSCSHFTVTEKAFMAFDCEIHKARDEALIMARTATIHALQKHDDL